MYICAISMGLYVVKFMIKLLRTVNTVKKVFVWKEQWDTSDFLYFIQSLAYNLCTQNVIDNRNVVFVYQGDDSIMTDFASLFRYTIVL